MRSGLCDEHSVKGILVMSSEGAGMLAIIEGYGQLEETLSDYHASEVPGQRPSLWELAKAMLRRDLARRGGTDVHRVVLVFECPSRGW